MRGNRESRAVAGTWILAREAEGRTTAVARPAALRASFYLPWLPNSAGRNRRRAILELPKAALDAGLAGRAKHQSDVELAPDRRYYAGVHPPRNMRKYPRLPLAVPVFVRASAREEASFLEFGTVLNISAGGVLLALRKAPRSRHLILEIPVAPAPAPEMPDVLRQIKASVVRRELHDDLTLLGLQFDRPLAG